MSGGEYDGTIRFNTKIDDSDLDSQLSNLNNRLQSASAKLRDIMQGPIAAAKEVVHVFVQVKQTLNSIESEWAASEEASSILAATLKATGAEAWTSKEEIEGMASSLQKVTKYGDETVITMENVLLGFKNIKGDNFKEASVQILNMATVMHMDLTSAAQAVGKALDDPIAGVDSLTRQGFRFSAQQKEVLKDLVETGKIEEAQKIILDELATTYGGAAEAAGSTASAIKVKLANALGDLNEEAGRTISNTLKPMREHLIEVVSGFTQWFKTMNDNGDMPVLLAKIGSGLETAAAGIAAFVLISKGSSIVEGMASAIRLLNAALFSNPYVLAAAGVVALVTAIISHNSVMQAQQEKLQGVIDKSSEAKEEAKKLATEYQTLADKAKPSADEQSRMAEIAKTLHDQFPDLTTDTINLAAANGTLAKDVGDAADAFNRMANNQRNSAIAKQLAQLADEANNYQKQIDILTGEDALNKKLGRPLANTTEIAEWVRKLKEVKEQEAKLIDEFISNQQKTYGISKPENIPLTPSTSTGASTTKSQGSRLKDLDDEYKARIAIAKKEGSDTFDIEKEWTTKKYDMLRSFVLEDVSKGITVENSLGSALANGYGKLGEILDATKNKLDNMDVVAPFEEADARAKDYESTQEERDDHLAAVHYKNEELADKKAEDSARKQFEYQAKEEILEDHKYAAHFKNEELADKRADDAAQKEEDRARQLEDVDDRKYAAHFKNEEIATAKEETRLDNEEQRIVDVQEADQHKFEAHFKNEELADKAIEDRAEKENELQAEIESADQHKIDAHLRNEELSDRAAEESAVKAEDLQIQIENAEQDKFDAHFKNEENADQRAEASASKAEQLQAEIESAEQHKYDSHFKNEELADHKTEEREFNEQVRIAEIEQADQNKFEAHFKNEERATKLLEDRVEKEEAIANTKKNALTNKYIRDESANDGGYTKTAAVVDDLTLSLQLQAAEMKKSQPSFDDEIARLIKTAEAAGVSKEEIDKLKAAYADLKKSTAIKDISDQWDDFVDKLKRNSDDWSDVFNSAYSALSDTFASAFETIGENIVDQTTGWTDWKVAALKAFASVLKSLGQQLLAQAAYNTVLAVTHLLMGDFAGAAAAAASALIAGTAAAAAFIGAGIVDGLADDVQEENKFTDALASSNKELTKNRELWTKASNAANAYSAVLAKVKSSVSSFYESLQNVGSDIADTIINGIIDGFSDEDIMYSLQEYITKAIVQVSVFTDSFMAEVSAIGTEIMTGLTNGISEDQLTALRDRLASLVKTAIASADVATSLVESVFASYDVGTLNVPEDMIAKIHGNEMILNAGIAEEARQAGIVIAPTSSLENAVSSTASLGSQSINLTLNLDGSITADGKAIGQIAYKYSDQLQAAAYGS